MKYVLFEETQNPFHRSKECFSKFSQYPITNLRLFKDGIGRFTDAQRPAGERIDVVIEQTRSVRVISVVLEIAGNVLLLAAGRVQQQNEEKRCGTKERRHCVPRCLFVFESWRE